MATDESSSTGPTNTNTHTSANLLSAAIGSNPSAGLQFPQFSFKLERSNYSVWRSNVLDALDAFGLKDFVISPSPPPKTLPVAATDTTPATTVPNPEFDVWNRKDKFILIWLRTTVSPALVGYLTKAHTSHHAWDALDRMFQSQSRARAMHIKQQLQTLQKGATSMVEYFEKKQALADSLTDCMQELSDDDLVACILQGMDSSYGPFRAAVNMRSEAIKPPDLLGFLLRLQSIT